MLYFLLLAACGNDISLSTKGCTTTFFPDSDGDGFGDDSNAAVICATDGYVEVGGDCDDGDAAVHPDASETCDGSDDDCDGLVDDADDSTDTATMSEFYGDGDADGFGDAESPVIACEAPSGFVEEAGDCDDFDATVNPDAVEECGGDDEDCDGLVDDADDSLDIGSASTWYADADADGYGDITSPAAACEGPAGTVTDATDCDDTNADINTAREEVCNGVDDDCDGATDDADDSVDLRTASTWYADLDGDTWGDVTDDAVACEAPAFTVLVPGDCDDDDASANPDGLEVCDGDDDDCDGLVDDDDDSLDVTTRSTWHLDLDADGYGDAATSTASCDAPSRYVADATDCNDVAATAYPGRPELCDDLDNDCDGSTDESGATGESTWYRDADGDGHGVPGSTARACDAPEGYVEGDEDCDDTEASVSPDAEEWCNDADDDCDGSVDESAVDAALWYDDDDGDGYGDSTDYEADCDAPRGHVAIAGDCDDLDDGTLPGGTEVCDGLDNDCNGYADDGAVDMTNWWPDGDGDGYGTGDYFGACEAPAGYVDNPDDCDDGNVILFPGAQEHCNGYDDDCDGLTDEAFWSADFSTTPGADEVSVNGDAYIDLDEGLLTLVDDIGEGGLAMLLEPIPTEELLATVTFELSGGYGTSASSGVAVFLVDASTADDWSGNGGTDLGVVGATGWIFSVETGSSGTGDAVKLRDGATGTTLATASLSQVQENGLHTLQVELWSGVYEVRVDDTLVLSGTLTGWTTAEYRVGVAGGSEFQWNRTDVDTVSFTCM